MLDPVFTYTGTSKVVLSKRGPRGSSMPASPGSRTRAAGARRMARTAGAEDTPSQSATTEATPPAVKDPAGAVRKALKMPLPDEVPVAVATAAPASRKVTVREAATGLPMASVT